jgi:hypothetical protein
MKWLSAYLRNEKKRSKIKQKTGVEKGKKGKIKERASTEK